MVDVASLDGIRPIRSTQFGAQDRNVNDSEKEGLPEFADEGTWAFSQEAEESDAFDEMNRGEHAEETPSETAN